MRHILLSLICLLFLTNINGQGKTTTPYTELNIGFSSGVVPLFPGASVLYGATTKYKSGFLLDYEAGLAFPSLITAKGGIGFLFNQTELSVGIRPWPASTYGQVRIDRPKKYSDIIISLETMPWANDLFIQRVIFTIGWRFDNKRYKDIQR